MNGATRRYPTGAWRRNRRHDRRPAPVAAGLRRAIPALLLAIGVALVVGACGGEADEHDVVEGEAAKLGELEYHVELTRFLNPADTEDAEYVRGRAGLDPGESYFGVFVRIENSDDERDLRSASDYTLVDVRGNRYQPIESEGPYALDVGGVVPAGGQLPLADSMAAMGPAKGGALIFRVDAGINQRLPLSLEIAAEGETATVQLDI